MNKKRTITYKVKHRKKCKTIVLPNEIIEYILSFIEWYDHFNLKLVCFDWWMFFKTNIRSVSTRHPNRLIKFYPNVLNVEIIFNDYDILILDEIKFKNVKHVTLYNFDFNKIILASDMKLDSLNIVSDHYNNTCLRPIFKQIINNKITENLTINYKNSYCMYCYNLYAQLPVKSLCIKNAREFKKSILHLCTFKTPN